MNIVWFRRNLRLEDNLPLFKAIEQGADILPIFIFDVDILANFPSPYDRRVCFIANALYDMHTKLLAHGGKMHIFYGKPQEIIANIVNKMGDCVSGIYIDEDFEPENIQRDKKVAQIAKTHAFCDHLLLKPGMVLNGSGQAFKVFTPFSKVFQNKIVELKVRQYDCELQNIKFCANQENLNAINFNCPQDITQQIGYQYKPDILWDTTKAHSTLESFVNNKIGEYKEQRDFMDQPGTSKLSPYIRFGLISIRECFLQSYELPNSQTWINELLWREFYANILFHFPRTINEEFLSQYSVIPWKRDQALADCLENSQTGFPIIDAAMSQLKQDGWIHNRSRMIVASFASKNLLLDWRVGDKLFGKYLMDYDRSSNIGGWQWSASCGTDAQPYFRIFNPFLQSMKFNPQGDYIKHYLPALSSVAAEHIHDGSMINQIYPHLAYPKEIVDYKQTRQTALELFSLK